MNNNKENSVDRLIIEDELLQTYDNRRILDPNKILKNKNQSYLSKNGHTTNHLTHGDQSKNKNYRDYYDNDSDSYDDSFENKVKTIQHDKNTTNKIKPDDKNNSLLCGKIPQTNHNNNFFSTKSKTEELKKNLRSVPKRKYATSPNDVRKMVKNESVKKFFANNNKSKQKNNSIIEYNNKSTHNLKNEIYSLKKEVTQLKMENKKIKELLEKERERNKMYKDFSEELIKQYE